MSAPELKQHRADLVAELRQVRRAIARNLRASGGRAAHSLQAELDGLLKELVVLAKQTGALTEQVDEGAAALSALARENTAAYGLLSPPSPSSSIIGFPERFAGVGAELESRDSWPVVARVFAGGPCEQAGVQVDDRVVVIDGRSVEGLSLGRVVASLRGRVDSEVTIELDRQGAGRTVVVRRQPLAKVTDGYAPE